MGPNGAGKSTLSKVIMGHEDYDVTAGSIGLDGEDLAELEAHERACKGIFVGYQYPLKYLGKQCRIPAPGVQRSSGIAW